MSKFMSEYEEQKLRGTHLPKYLKVAPKTANVRRFELITEQMAAIYARKNKDYGNSFDISLDEDGLLVAKIRLGDKFKRFAQLINNDAEVIDESKRDTLIDMANYAIMTVMWMDSKEEEISFNDDKNVTADEELYILE